MRAIMVIGGGIRRAFGLRRKRGPATVASWAAGNATTPQPPEVLASDRALG
jgi:hypothetical protein